MGSIRGTERRKSPPFLYSTKQTKGGGPSQRNPSSCLSEWLRGKSRGTTLNQTLIFCGRERERNWSGSSRNRMNLSLFLDGSGLDVGGETISFRTGGSLPPSSPAESCLSFRLEKRQVTTTTAKTSFWRRDGFVFVLQSFPGSFIIPQEMAVPPSFLQNPSCAPLFLKRFPKQKQFSPHSSLSP